MANFVTARFLNIYLNQKPGITLSDIETEMNNALDWFRYDSKCWVIYSNSSIDTWIVRLKKLVEPNGRLFICKLDINDKNGWMTREFWDWINKQR